MNLQGVDLNLLLIFEAVYLDRNLTHAGQRLNLSQPAVSNALKRLRDRVQDPLFVRTTEGMVPTAYAEDIMPTVSEALNNLRACLANTGEFQHETSKYTFRLIMSDYNGAIILPKLMNYIQTHAPNISIVNMHIDRVSAYEQIKDGRAEFVISTGLNGPNMFQQKLFSDEYVTLVRKKHPIIKDELSLDDFCRIPHILFSLEGKGVSNVDTALAKLSRTRKIALRLPHVSVVPKVLEETDYLVNLPTRVAYKFLENHDLKIFPTPVELESYAVYQYWHTRQHQDPAHIWLRSVLKQLSFDS